MSAGVRGRPVAIFLVLAFSITWVVWVPRAAGVAWATGLGGVWTYGPALAAMLAALLTGGREELRALGRRFDHWRIGGGWYAVVVLGPVVLALVQATLATMLFGGSWGSHLPAVFDEPVPIWLLLSVILTVTDGLGEEVGWRGFALPHLLRGRNATLVSLGLGLAWALWHLPLFATEGGVLEGAYVWALVLRLPALAIVYTWVFQRTGGSIVAAALLHGCINVFSVPPAVSGDPVGPVLVSLGLTWAIAGGLVVKAGAARLDAWPRSRRPAVGAVQPADVPV